MPDIGDQLRETRMRQRIDITEVEAATKIRAKYLRALESEEWELLPGPTFVKTFLRTYAEYLELDARLLVEEGKQRRKKRAAARPMRVSILATGQVYVCMEDSRGRAVVDKQTLEAGQRTPT